MTTTHAVATETDARICNEVKALSRRIRDNTAELVKNSATLAGHVENNRRIDTGWVQQSLTRIAEANNKRQILMDLCTDRETVTLAATTTDRVWFVTLAEMEAAGSR